MQEISNVHHKFYHMILDLQKRNCEKCSSPLYNLSVQLIADIYHTTLYRSYYDSDSLGCRMNHLTASAIDSAVACIHTHISWLRIACLRPCKEGVCSPETRIASCQTVAYESGTVKGVRPFGPIHIGTAELRTCNGYQGGGFPASA